MLSVRNFMARFVLVRSHLIVDEKDVTRILKVINAHHKNVPNMQIGKCEWADDRNKWFVHYDSNEYAWELIRKELSVCRVYSNTDIPKSAVGAVFSTD